MKHLSLKDQLPELNPAQWKLLERVLLDEVIGDDKHLPVGEMGKFDPVTRTYELLTDTDAVKYHLQRAMNRNDLKAEQRARLAVLLGEGA